MDCKRDDCGVWEIIKVYIKCELKMMGKVQLVIGYIEEIIMENREFLLGLGFLDVQ